MKKCLEPKQKLQISRKCHIFSKYLRIFVSKPNQRKNVEHENMVHGNVENGALHMETLSYGTSKHQTCKMEK